MTKTGLVKAASVVAALTIVSKILGFIRETSLAAVFGATSDTDAYLLAQTIPHLLFAAISYALTTTFIPVYSHVREERGKEAGFRFANNVIWALLFVAVLFVFAGEALAEQLVRFVAPGLDDPVAKLTEYLSRIIFPMMLFQLLSGVVTGILQADGEFGVPTAAGLAQNVAIIVSILVFGPRYGIASVAVGTLVGAGLALFVKLPALAGTGFRWRAVFDLRDPGLKRMFILMLPAILGAGANQVNTLVDRMLASGLAEGRLTALNYANRLTQLAPGIIGASITTVVYPTLARLAAKKDWQRFSAGVVSSLSLVHFLLLPIAVGVLVLREPLVRIVYERGAFDAVATNETAWALLFFSIGIAAFPMQDLVSRTFFTLQDTKTPLVLGGVTVATNVILNLLLVGPLEQGGLALATVVATTVGLILGLFALKRRGLGKLTWKPLLVSMGKTLIASLIMGFAVIWVYRYSASLVPGQRTVHELVRTGLAAVFGAALYLALTWVLRVEELQVAVNYVLGLSKRLGSLRAKVG
ncbi:MAG: murein biosynthesis integral membrane protein MurJ [Trueperella sp.]|nr:murein biosynthesis integral membrane protein MurJ [Trueperella sp.]